MNIIKMLEILWGGVRSIPINFKLFPLGVALRFQIIISPFVKIKSLRGKIIIDNSKIKTGMIRIGFGEVGIFDKLFSRTILEIDGKIIFSGTANIGHGSKISVGKNGMLEIGENFIITAESSIVCFNNIKFGDNNLISWENLFLDNDFHKIKAIESNEVTNKGKKIMIGNNVWFGCRNTILKGTEVLNDTVIGANSVLNKKFLESNILIAGNPAKIVKKNIKWEN